MNAPDSRDVPLPPASALPERLADDDRIRFRCHRGVACWNACCRNIDIALTPYDVIQLKQRLGITSSEFLERYTVRYEMENGGFAGVKLKPIDGGTACRFMVAEGCSVYADRPAACRYYPVAPLTPDRAERSDRDAYALVRDSYCLGHNEPREITIRDYRSEQGLPEYDALTRGWRELLTRAQSPGPRGDKPSKRNLELFFMTCYDLDRFRSLVASDAFSEVYDVAEDEMHTILTDDVALMLFGLRLLRQTMFGELTICTRPGAGQGHGRYAPN
jgi:uncharacterized protein